MMEENSCSRDAACRPACSERIQPEQSKLSCIECFVEGMDADDLPEIAVIPKLESRVTVEPSTWYAAGLSRFRYVVEVTSGVVLETCGDAKPGMNWNASL